MSNNDTRELGEAVVAIVQDTLLPFDIDVVLVDNSVLEVATRATDLSDIQDLMADSSTNDAYVFVMTVGIDVAGDGNFTRVEELNPTELGRAAKRDLGFGTNATDEAAIAFANTILLTHRNDHANDNPPLDEASFEFRDGLAHRLAYTATHEAFHTFGFSHVSEQTVNELAGNVIVMGTENTQDGRENPLIVTRNDHWLEYNTFELAVGDGSVNVADIDEMFQALAILAGTSDPSYQSWLRSIYDLNGDDTIDQLDADYLIENIIGTAYGDANLDGHVDQLDLDIVNLYWQQEVESWAEGDFNGDGIVDSTDLTLVALNWGFVASWA